MTEEPDVILVVDSEKFSACRSVLLKHSDYFRAMFQHNFSEKHQNEIVLKYLQPSSIRIILHWANAPSDQLPPMSTSTACSLLQASGMLQFQKVRALCIKLLLDRIEDNCFEIIAAAELYGDEMLLHTSLNFALCKFVQIGEAAIANENNSFVNCDIGTLKIILENPKLNCGYEETLRRILGHWKEASQGRTNEDVNDLIEIWRAVKRKLPWLPCVVGHRLSDKLLLRGREGGGGCKKGFATLLAFNKERNEIEEITNLEEADNLAPLGFKTISVNSTVILAGGELHLGYNTWCYTIRSYDILTKAWRELGQLSVSRRHHAMVLVDNNLYVLGGYGKHRVVLDSVECFNIKSRKVTQCAPLPQPMRRPAAAFWQDQLIVCGDGKVIAYKSNVDQWVDIGATVPRGVEVDNAVAGEDGNLYLTATCSSAIYRLSANNNLSEINVVGHFSREAGNTCMVDNVLYNFYSDEFGYERVVESYNTITGKCEVLFKQDLPQWSFSPAPQYSYGCFSILHYT